MKILLINTARNEIQSGSEYITKGLSFLKSYEIDIEIAEDSVDPKVRADILVRNLNRTDIDYIWILRGGINTIELLPHIDFENLKFTTPIIGLSDFTHLALPFVKYGNKAIYGPTFKDWVEDLTPDQKDKIVLKLKSKKLGIETAELASVNDTSNITNKFVGGTLLCIYGLLDTKYMPDLNNCDLFIEHHYVHCETEKEMIYWLNTLKLKLQNIKINSLIFGDLSYNVNEGFIAEREQQINLIQNTFGDVRSYAVKILRDTHYTELVELG